MSDNEARFVRLSWALIEYKVMYYRPHLVHESRHEGLTIHDETYDTLEIRYLTLCRELGHQNTIVHKDYPGFEDIDGEPMIEIDEDRPSVQLVLDKLKTRRQETDDDFLR